jgi:hypothetical protein
MDKKPGPQDEIEKINENFKTIDLGSKFPQKPTKTPEPDQKGPMFYHYLLNDFNAMKYYQTDVLEQPFKKLEHYADISKIKCAFPSTLRMNDPNFEPNRIKKAKFFILRSTCDDDIHKAIKYGMWTSTYKNNVLLNDLFKKYSRSGTPIYLIFTVVGSGQYCGMAQMASEVELKKTFSYWWEEVKWSGVFKINWIFVKDLLYDEVENIRLKNGNKVVSSKDGTELDYDTGLEMAKRFKNSVYVSDIFEFFEFMDNREEKIRLKRDSMNQIISKLKSKGLIPNVPPKHHRRKHKKNFDGRGKKTKGNPEHMRHGQGKRGGPKGNFNQFYMGGHQGGHNMGFRGPMMGNMNMNMNMGQMHPGMMYGQGKMGMYPGFTPYHANMYNSQGGYMYGNMGYPYMQEKKGLGQSGGKTSEGKK